MVRSATLRNGFFLSVATVLICGTGVISELLSAQECPPCTYDSKVLQPLQQHGNVGGRRIVKMCIDGSWDTFSGSHQTIPKIWNQVNNAIAEWNNTSGSTSQTIPYKLVLDQNDFTGCDIRIVKDIFFPCAASAPNRNNPLKWSIGLGPNVINNTDTDLKALIAHEFGHPLGLANVALAQGGACPSGSDTSDNFSIMGSGSPGPNQDLCISFTKSVRPRDVDVVREKFGNGSDVGNVSGCAYSIEEDLFFDACSSNPCLSFNCPNFDFDACVDLVLEEEQEFEYVTTCYDVYRVTSYYSELDGSLTYLGSTVEYSYSYCKVEPIPVINES